LAGYNKKDGIRLVTSPQPEGTLFFFPHTNSLSIPPTLSVFTDFLQLTGPWATAKTMNATSLNPQAFWTVYPDTPLSWDCSPSAPRQDIINLNFCFLFHQFCLMLQV
jgi:hypothetical protein